MVDTAPLDAAERVELTIGLAETLYFEDRYGAAAQLFESVRQRSVAPRHARARARPRLVGDLGRQAGADASARRTSGDLRADPRPHDEEMAEYPGSTAAGYWLAAAARASGDVERAWHAALAGWLRATLADDRGVALRADLDRLMTQAIIPERAAKLAARSDCSPGWIPKTPRAR